MRTSVLQVFAVLVVLGLVVDNVSCQGTKRARKKARQQQPVDEDGEAEAEAAKSFHMQESVDGKVWQNKGKVVVGRYLNVWFEASHGEWEKPTVDSLLKKDIYYVRVSRTPTNSFAEVTVDNSVLLGLSVCELVNSAFEEHFQVTFAPHDNFKGTIIGLGPAGSAYIKTRSASLDACTSAELLDSRFALLSQPLAHAPVMHDKPPSRPATFGIGSSDDSIYQQMNAMTENARKHQEAQRRKDADPDAPVEKPEEEKSWFERYWLYIVMAFLLMRLQGAVPDQPQEGAAPSGNKRQ